MEIYSRNITNRLLFLRILLPVLVIISIDAFDHDLELAGYISALLVIFLGFIRVTTIIIHHDETTIRRYYFFGLIPVNYTSDKNKPGSALLVNRFEEMQFGNSETLADLILPFLPTEAQTTGLMIVYSAKNGRTRREYASISSKEFERLRPYFRINNEVPSM